MKVLIDKLRAIVQEINELHGIKEVTMSEGDFERAACLRDLANAIRKHVAWLIENKPKRYATTQDILGILEHSSPELYEKLGTTPELAKLSLSLKHSTPVVLVVFKKAIVSTPAEILWELPDIILLVQMEHRLNF